MPKFIEDGPELPEEVLRAHEEERLVLFCGAGISMGTGLPGFKDLTWQIANELGQSLSGTVDPASTAFTYQQYDRTLHLLELAASANLVRRAAIDILSRPTSKSALKLHKSILDISQLKAGGCRIITTNYDDRFQRAAGRRHEFEAAPALSPARPEQWSRIVYLHGRIDPRADPDGQRLVLTSGDFGKAYLRDAWAARFVVEMFREFTVLFIGYSVNDSILRYLIDALSSESREGGRFRRSFALDGAKAGDEHRVELEWRAKGVHPIIYRLNNSKGKEHRVLSNILEAWASDVRTGTKSRINMALQPMRNPYSTSTSGPRSNSAIWAIADQDGTVAKAIADENPPPDISWLDAMLTIPVRDASEGTVEFLLSSGIRLKSPQDARTRNRLVGWDSIEPNRSLNPIEHQICRWLCKHLDKLTLVRWVVENHGLVNSEFLNLIVATLEDTRGSTPPSEAMGIAVSVDIFDNFWKLIVSGLCAPAFVVPGDSIFVFANRRKLIPLEWYGVLASISPFIQVSKSIRFGQTEGVAERLSDHLSFAIGLSRGRSDIAVDEIISRISDNNLGDLSTVERHLDQVTTILLRAVWLAVYAQIGEVLQYSSITIRQVWKAGQYEDASGLGKIFSIFRATLLAGISNSSPEVQLTLDRILDQYRATDASLLARIAIFIFTDYSSNASGRDVEFLAENNWRQLWAADSKPEVLRYLRKRGNSLSRADKSRIHKELARRLNEVRSSSLTNDEEYESNIHQVCSRIEKLVEGGVSVPKRLKNELSIWAKSHPRTPKELSLGEANRTPVDFQWIAPAKADRLVDISDIEVMERLVEWRNRREASQMFADLFKRAAEKAIRVFALVISNNHISKFPEGVGLSNALEDKGAEDVVKLLKDIADIVLSFPTKLDDVLKYDIPRFLDLVQRFIEPDSEHEKTFFQVWSRAWQSFKDAESGLVSKSDNINTAINAPGGILAEALLKQVWARNPQAGALLLPEIRVRLDLIVSDDSTGGRFGRIVIAANLVNLHFVDGQWCTSKVVPMLMLEHPEALQLWNGFLFSGNWSAQLLGEISNSFCDVGVRLGDLDDGPRKQYVQILTASVIQHPKLFEISKLQAVFRSLEVSSIQTIAWFLGQWLKSVGKTSGQLWREKISPFVKQHWPVGATQRTKETSISVAQMILRTGDAFPQALALVERRELLQVGGNVDSIVYELHKPSRTDTRSDKVTTFEYNLVEKHPREVKRLIERIIDSRTVVYNQSALVEILNKLK
jgi:hypothetical protein